MSERRPVDGDLVIEAARRWKGTPYIDQASLRGVGCDCLGLARGVWRDVVGPEPVGVPAYSRDWGQVGKRENLMRALGAHMIFSEPYLAEPGNVILFDLRRGPAKHMGILLAEDRFIHALERHGVVEQEFSPWWRERVRAAFAYPRRES